MRSRTTIILILIAAALGAYVWFFERHQIGTTEREQTAHLVLTLAKEKIQHITLQRAADQVQLEKRSDGLWYIQGEVDDRAEQAAVGVILDLASAFEITRTIPGKDVEDGDVKVVDLGLDATHNIRVVYAAGDETLATLIVGNVAPWKDTVYCRVENNPERKDVYVASTAARPMLLQPAEAFRDTFLSAQIPARLTTVSIHQSGATEIELQRTQGVQDAPWLLTKPLRTNADSDAFNKLLNRFVKVRIDAFIPGEGDLPAALPGDAVVVTMQAANAQSTVTLLPPAEEDSASSVAYISDRKGAFQIDDEFRQMFTAPDQATPLWQLLRSRKLGRINPELVTTIVIRELGKQPLPIWYFGGSWYLNRDSPYAEQADKKRLLELIEGLNQEDILEFSSDTGEDLEKYGLADPRFRIEFSGVVHQSKGAPTAPAPENVMSLFIGHGKDGRIYAKYSGEPFVFQIRPSVLGLLHEPIKWKDRSLLAFSQSAVQGIIITRPPEPPVEFKYNNSTAEWSASSSGEDVTALIDLGKLRDIRAKLAIFYADDWSSSFAPLENLKNYKLEIRLIGTTYEEGADEPTAVTRILRFASTDPKNPNRRTEFYFGQIDNIPEPFIIRRETYEKLYDSLLKEKSGDQ